jgi:hypothetical protein
MFTRILLALVVISAMSISPTQSHLQNTTTLPTEVTVAVWSPATGRQATIPAQQRLSAFQDGQTVIVYDAEVTPTVLASLIDSSQKWDSSRAVKVTIWMYWNGFDYGGLTYVSVSKYQTMWQLYDSTVSMRSASMNAGCSGEAWSGSISCIPPKSQSRWIGTPTSGVRYSLSPSWAGNYIATGYLIGYQAGNSKVQLKRGTATWWLQICIYKGSCGIDA